MLLIDLNDKVKLQHCARILGQDTCMCCQLDSSDKQRPGEFKKKKVLPLQYLGWLLVSQITIKCY